MKRIIMALMAVLTVQIFVSCGNASTPTLQTEEKEIDPVKESRLEDIRWLAEVEFCQTGLRDIVVTEDPLNQNSYYIKLYSSNLIELYETWEYHAKFYWFDGKENNLYDCKRRDNLPTEGEGFHICDIDEIETKEFFRHIDEIPPHSTITLPKATAIVNQYTPSYLYLDTSEVWMYQNEDSYAFVDYPILYAIYYPYSEGIIHAGNPRGMYRFYKNTGILEKVAFVNPTFRLTEPGITKETIAQVEKEMIESIHYTDYSSRQVMLWAWENLRISDKIQFYLVQDYNEHNCFYIWVREKYKPNAKHRGWDKVYWFNGNTSELYLGDRDDYKNKKVKLVEKLDEKYMEDFNRRLKRDDFDLD